MLKTILTALILVSSVSLMAQNLDDIKAAAGKNQWDKAKEGIDKYLSSEKNAKKGEGWYVKAMIYNGIARDTAGFAKQYPDARMESFNAYKKYLEIDPKAVEGTISQHGTLFDVAFGYQDQAIRDFNAKNYDGALDAFKNLETVETYIADKGFSYGAFSFAKVDTQLYLNIAAAAINAKKDDVAVEYYKKIADNKIKDKGYEEIYRYIVDYYYKKGDKANTDKYLAVGREVYPTDQYWCEFTLYGLDKDKKALFEKYDALLDGGPCDNYNTRYNYAVEMYNYNYTQDKKPDDYAAIQTKLEDVMKKALEMNSTPEANLLMTRHLYNQAYDYIDAQSAIKGVKPDDQKKKAELKKKEDEKLDEMLKYAQAAYSLYDAKTDLKSSERGSFKIAINFIVEYYTLKNQKDKAKPYQDKAKALGDN